MENFGHVRYLVEFVNLCLEEVDKLKKNTVVCWMQNDIIICTVSVIMCLKGNVDRVKKPVLLHTIQGSGKECWNISSQDYSFSGTFILMMELSFSGPLVPWNFRSRERTNKPCRPFPLRTICSMDRSFPGTFIPGTLDLSCRRSEQYIR